MEKYFYISDGEIVEGTDNKKEQLLKLAGNYFKTHKDALNSNLYKAWQDEDKEVPKIDWYYFINHFGIKERIKDSDNSTDKLRRKNGNYFYTPNQLLTSTSYQYYNRVLKQCSKCGVVDVISAFHRGTNICKVCRHREKREKSDYYTKIHTHEWYEKLEKSDATLTCSKCGKTKHVTEFTKYRLSKTGYKPRCWECQHPGKSREVKKPSKILYKEKEGYKRCSICGEVKPISEFYKSKSYCITCSKEFDRKKRIRNTAKHTDAWYEEQLRAGATVRCKKCGKIKPVSEFSRVRKTQNGYEYYCNECISPEKYKENQLKSKLSLLGLRKCKDCGEIKPISEFTANGVRCSSCHNLLYYKGYKKPTTIKQRTIPPTKVCPKCGIEKPSSEFYLNHNHLDGLHHHCKSCDRILSKIQDRKRKLKQREKLIESGEVKVLSPLQYLDKDIIYLGIELNDVGKRVALIKNMESGKIKEMHITLIGTIYVNKHTYYVPLENK